MLFVCSKDYKFDEIILKIDKIDPYKNYTITISYCEIKIVVSPILEILHISKKKTNNDFEINQMYRSCIVYVWVVCVLLC